MTIKRKINLILESPHIGFWRICGKDLQKKYREKNRADGTTDYEREILLQDIVSLYNACLDTMGCMGETERKAKKDRIKRYSEGGTL